MATMVTFKVEGQQDLKNLLRQLKEKDIVDAAYSGSAGGAAQVRNNAKRNAAALWGVRTGRLVNGIIMKKERRATQEFVSYIIAVRTGRRAGGKSFSAWVSAALAGDPYYWRFLEFGTSKIAAKPFMVPALANNRTSVAETIGSKMRVRIKRNKLIR